MGSPRRADLIAAPATPPGAAERAVLRLSGPDLLQRAAGLLPAGGRLPGDGRRAVACRLEWTPGSRVDAWLLAFPGPASATGEDVLEIHLPGCQPVVEAVFATLLRRGVRRAEPGEFTRRAFRNGRLDLAQAEAVLALVESRTRAGVVAAGEALAGRLAADLRAARQALADALTETEAGLDFEEGDAADLQPAELHEALHRARAALEAARRGEARRPAAGGAPRMGLLGPPNAGKTLLFRRLTGAPGLVSSEPGTTRDRLEAAWRVGGREVLLADGPGLGGRPAGPRDAAARRRHARDRFDLVGLVADASDPAARAPRRPATTPSLVIWTHCDLPRRIPEAEAARAASEGPAVWVSALSGSGLEALAGAVAALLRGPEAAAEGRMREGERHRAALDAALAALGRAEEQAGAGPSDLLAEDLRAALRPLGEILGEFTPEDLLDRVFARFCIGK